MSDRRRCPWGESHPLYVPYHDREWGKPLHDDRRFFELLVLEGAQAGLSWLTILKKRDAYRKAFDGFDPRKVARYDAKKVARLLADDGIIRNRLKIEAAITNAHAFLAVQREFGSFDAYVWRFVGGKPIQQPPAEREGGAGALGGVGRDERGTAEEGIPFRRLDDLLRVHAGGGHGQRPPGHLLSVPRGSWRRVSFVPCARRENGGRLSARLNDRRSSRAEAARRSRGEAPRRD